MFIQSSVVFCWGWRQCVDAMLCFYKPVAISFLSITSHCTHQPQSKQFFHLIHLFTSLMTSYHDGLWWIGSTDIHHDVIILVKVDSCLIVGKNGVFIFREGWGNIRDPWSCRKEQILFVLPEWKQFHYSTVIFIYIQQFSDLLSSSPASLLSLSSPVSETTVNHSERFQILTEWLKSGAIYTDVE